MAIQKWCIKASPFYDKPGGTKQNMFVTLNRLYDVTSHQQVFQGKTWSELKFTDRDGIEKTGWVQDVYLEDLIEDPDSQGFEVPIPHPTPDSTDAAQYLNWENSRHNNMCGELCVAFIGGDDIETFLTKWKQMNGTLYKTIVPNDKTTGETELDNMLKVYGYPAPNVRFEDGLKIPDIELRMSPGRFQKMLATHYLIAAVRIDSVAGNIGDGDVGHWVVLDKVIPDGVDKGWVEIYNPFPNKRQKYSYGEFIRSCKAEGLTGLWVNRIPPMPGG